MEKIIRKALDMYTTYRADAQYLEQMVELSDDVECIRKLTILETKIIIINCWFQLLTDDEALVITWRLINKCEWKRVVIKYKDRWGGYVRSERTLQLKQRQALNKMIAFSEERSDVIHSLFHDIMKERTVEERFKALLEEDV